PVEPQPVVPLPSPGPSPGRPRNEGTPTIEPPVVQLPAGPTSCTITLSGTIPPELWNRLGTRVLPKLRSGNDLKVGINFSVTVEAGNASDLQADLKQILMDLGLENTVDIEQE